MKLLKNYSSQRNDFKALADKISKLKYIIVASILAKSKAVSINIQLKFFKNIAILKREHGSNQNKRYSIGQKKNLKSKNFLLLFLSANMF